MKTIAKIDQSIGGDGAILSGQLGVEGSNLKAEVSVTYPIEKVVAPATKAVDNLLEKLEKAIPGDWDKPILEKAKAEFKEELIKLLSE